MARDLRLRILSILVLVPFAGAVVYFGGWVFAAAVALAGAIMLGEIFRLVDVKNWVLTSVATAWLLAMAIYLALAGSIQLALGVSGAGAALAAGLASSDTDPMKTRLWAFCSFAYISVPCVLLVLLRDARFGGLETVAWLFLAVWAMDIGAYVAGRTIGGPKLWPAVSPNKTWAGFVGGVLLAGVAGGVIGVIFGSAGIVALVALAALVAAWSQLGDLAESAVKRKFGAKDTSPLIPGHGGLLDRLDSTLFGAVAAVAIVILKEGPVVPWA